MSPEATEPQGTETAPAAPLDAAPESRDSTPTPESLPPPGNPLRKPGRIQWLGLLGATIALLIMATDVHFWFSVPVGFIGCALAALAILDFLGTFDDPAAQSASVRFAELAPRVAEFAGSVLVLVGALRLAVSGVLPKPIFTAGLLVTVGLLWMTVSACRIVEKLGVWADSEVAFWKRHGFWLIALNILLYIPLLGSYSLSDPWETHYGEVAREMLARDDWISLWWAQDGWFWSKPVLDFWLQGLAFSLLGVRFMPDEMLGAVAQGRFPQPEWAARLPVIVLTVIATYLLYKAVARVFNRRAGFLAGLLLTTMPYWYLIAHQSMTDMPYVAPLTAALSLALLALNTDPDARVKSFDIAVAGRTFRVSAFHLLFAVILLSALPQIFYLLSRHLTLQLANAPRGFRWHLDEFFYGSGGGNCGLPGNDTCRYVAPLNLIVQPVVGALLWAAALGYLLWMNRGERRLQRLLFLGAWYFTALSALGKGAPGLVLPLVTVLVAIGAARRFRDLTRIELAGLALIVACVCLPWYVQMYMRHGQPFTDRLLFHDMYKRAFLHVHDTNVGDDVSFRYYIWQLGYGLFPWTGLAAGGLIWWLRFRDEATDARGQAGAFFALWFVIAFSMFTITLTKFHHYVLPAVPPIAALTGVLLDRTLGEASFKNSRDLPMYLTGLALSVLLLVYGVTQLGGIDENAPAQGAVLRATAGICLGLALTIFAAYRWGGRSDVPQVVEQRHESAIFGALGLVAAVPVALAGRDMFTTLSGDVDGQARLLHLFTYNYKREFPDTLDFNAVLCAFTAVSTCLCALYILPRFRRHMTAMICAIAIVWTAWGLDVYLVKTAPHWGQRETVMAYYANRESANEPFVAFQMNWKGENFYTGNRVPAFVQSGQKFKDWLKAQKAKGVKVMFFSTEHSRINTLKNELGSVKEFKQLTHKDLNNKFFVARVEL